MLLTILFYQIATYQLSKKMDNLMSACFQWDFKSSFNLTTS